jgi:hypothetical protein
MDFMINDMKLETARATGHFTIVDPASQEYKKIADLFLSTVSATILRIEKNHNPELYKRHLALCSNAEIKYLFHGSRHDNYIKIMSNGFDINLSKCGSLGRGIYFADDASYSNSYTNVLDMDGVGVANMLVCRVYLREDTRYGVKIHCVQHQDLGYPEYVVYYCRKKD